MNISEIIQLSYLKTLNETTINIDLSDRTKTSTDNNVVKYKEFTKNQFGRLFHLFYELDDNGSPIIAEKISALLFNAVNLNYYNKSYPFVDLIVPEDKSIEGITLPDEYISVKTSAKANTLNNAINEVNGFKLSQVLQFALQMTGVDFFEGENFSKRNTIKYFTILNELYKIFKIKQNATNYELIFKNQLKYIYLLKKIMDNGRTYNGKILNNINNINEFFTDIIDKDLRILNPSEMKKSHELDDYIKEYDEMNNFYSKFHISYCVSYFDKDSDINDSIILHVQKTKAINFIELYEKTIKEWVLLDYHKRILDDETSKNYYLKYNNIKTIFSEGDDFSNHIILKMSKEKRKKYFDISKDDTKTKDYHNFQNLKVEVIDNIKSIPNDKMSKDVLNFINNIVNKLDNENVNKENIIKQFKDFNFDSI